MVTNLNPDYPVMEVAINLIDNSPLESGHERSLVGDIIGIRNPNIGVGRKEVENYMWLRIEGLEKMEFYRLTDSIITSAGKYDKRRYCIPLEKIKEISPEFDIDLALEEDKIYQPFLLVDYDEGYYFVLEDGQLPLQVSGLVFDKETQEYI